ncbi:MAG: hypothetical protein GC162_13055 [Planctomycetes bacterium]|nr:hypothetical protein [Planctomycetota bacterium]
MRLLRTIRRTNPGAPLIKIFWWWTLQFLLRLLLGLAYRHRWYGARNIPAEGPVLLVSNHQSYLDLVLLGTGISHRHFHPMARHTLFRNRFFAALIRSLNAFEVDQSKGDIRAMRLAIDKLTQGHLLLVFPEGGRTADGAVHPFMPGVMLLIKRAKPKVIPAAIEGAFDVWPIHASRPKIIGYTAVKFGEPIDSQTLADLPTHDALSLLHDRVEALRLELRAQMRQRSRGRFPAPSAGDAPDESSGTV